MNQLSILIYQQQGSQVDWYDIDFIGPFSSPEERDAYIEKNPAEPKHRYKVEFLRDPKNEQ